MSSQKRCPEVSILLPNLNYRRFLNERIQSILTQTLTDWELIIVDSYSDDGAWELIQNFAERDSRIRASQAPREGIYAGLNRCIHLARGKYVYIATSDDSMSPDCLEKMVRALEEHPNCDICHCCLNITDEDGNETHRWYNYSTAQFYGELIYKSHIRLAPHDGILHCIIHPVYTSLTQLLIRRAVFDKVGLFRTDWGSTGDVEWGMRTSLVCNTIHIPEMLATWRKHVGQATAQISLSPSAQKGRFCEMLKAALPVLGVYKPEIYKKVRVSRLLLFYRYQQLRLGVGERKNLFSKISYLIHFLFISPNAIWNFLCRHFSKKESKAIDGFSYGRKILEEIGLTDCVKIIQNSQ